MKTILSLVLLYCIVTLTLTAVTALQLTAGELKCKRSLHPFKCVQLFTACNVMSEYAYRYHILRDRGQILLLKAYDTLHFLSSIEHWVKRAIALDLAIVINMNGYRDMMIMLEPNLISYEYDADVDLFMIDSDSILKNNKEMIRKSNIKGNSNGNNTHVVRSIGKTRNVKLIVPKSMELELEKSLNNMNTKTGLRSKANSNLYSFINENKHPEASPRGQLKSSPMKTPDYCIYNGLFRWTSYADSIYNQYVEDHPLLTSPFTVWHFRTSSNRASNSSSSSSSSSNGVGENRRIQKHILNMDKLSNAEVCRVYNDIHDVELELQSQDQFRNNSVNTFDSSVILLMGNSGEVKKTCIHEITDKQLVSIPFPFKEHRRDRPDRSSSSGAGVQASASALAPDALSPSLSQFLDLMILTRSVGVISNGGTFPLLPSHFRPSTSMSSISGSNAQPHHSSHPNLNHSVNIGLWAYRYSDHDFVNASVPNPNLGINHNYNSDSTHNYNSDSTHNSLDITTIPLLPYNTSTFTSASRTLGCGEALWCSEADNIQKHIYKWQNPSPQACRKAKFLVYEPYNYGIGSMIHIAAAALSVAICSGRILYFPQITFSENDLWRSLHCKGTSMECYFERVTTCILDESDFDTIPIWHDASSIVNNNSSDSDTNTRNTGTNTDQYVRLENFPSGPCGFCGDFTGYPFIQNIMGKNKYKIEAPLMSQHVRYLMRPLESLRVSIIRFLESQPKPMRYIPKPYASMHVRYGDKYVETPRVPLHRYMEILSVHYPMIRSVFISTETYEVVSNLTRDYPEYAFYFLEYNRIETFNPNQFQSESTLNEKSEAGVTTTNTTPIPTPGTLIPTASQEFIASMSNLMISIQANAFVGSLTSNWCRLIHELERNRGDGGSEYYSVDGSQFSTCHGDIDIKKAN